MVAVIRLRNLAGDAYPEKCGRFGYAVRSEIAP